MAPLDPVVTDARNATIVTGLAFASLCLLGFYWRMRRARVSEMMRSRTLLQKAYAELNQHVAERTADLSQANDRLKREVSERTRAEHELRAAHDELIQASKLAALGQMAAGITHELTSRSPRCAASRTTHGCCSSAAIMSRRRETSKRLPPLTERMGKITNQLKLFVGRARPRSARGAGGPRAVQRADAAAEPLDDAGVEVAVSLLDTANAAAQPSASVSISLASIRGWSPIATNCGWNRC